MPCEEGGQLDLMAPIFSTQRDVLLLLNAEALSPVLLKAAMDLLRVCSTQICWQLLLPQHTASLRITGYYAKKYM